jgi:hypothetical protein
MRLRLGDHQELGRLILLAASSILTSTPLERGARENCSDLAAWPPPVRIPDAIPEASPSGRWPPTDHASA